MAFLNTIGLYSTCLIYRFEIYTRLIARKGGGPRVVVSTAAFARARGSVPGLGGLKETKMFLLHPRVKVSIVGSLRDREVACSASDRARISNSVSGGQCHLNHLTILRRFSWPSLAYMCLYVQKRGHDGFFHFNAHQHFLKPVFLQIF